MAPKKRLLARRPVIGEHGVELLASSDDFYNDHLGYKLDKDDKDERVENTSLHLVARYWSKKDSDDETRYLSLEVKFYNRGKPKSAYFFDSATAWWLYKKIKSREWSLGQPSWLSNPLTGLAGVNNPPVRHCLRAAGGAAGVLQLATVPKHITKLQHLRSPLLSDVADTTVERRKKESKKKRSKECNHKQQTTVDCGPYAPSGKGVQPAGRSTLLLRTPGHSDDDGNKGAPSASDAVGKAVLYGMPPTSTAPRDNAPHQIPRHQQSAASIKHMQGALQPGSFLRASSLGPGALVQQQHQGRFNSTTAQQPLGGLLAAGYNTTSSSSARAAATPSRDQLLQQAINGAYDSSNPMPAAGKCPGASAAAAVLQERALQGTTGSGLMSASRAGSVSWASGLLGPHGSRQGGNAAAPTTAGAAATWQQQQQLDLSQLTAAQKALAGLRPAASYRISSSSRLPTLEQPLPSDPFGQMGMSSLLGPIHSQLLGGEVLETSDAARLIIGSHDSAQEKLRNQALGSAAGSRLLRSSLHTSAPKESCSAAADNTPEGPPPAAGLLTTWKRSGVAGLQHDYVAAIAAPAAHALAPVAAAGQPEIEELMSDMLAALDNSLGGSAAASDIAPTAQQQFQQQGRLSLLFAADKSTQALLTAAVSCHSSSSSRLPAVQLALPSDPFHRAAMPLLPGDPRGFSGAGTAAGASGAGSTGSTMSAAGRQSSSGKECVNEPSGVAAGGSTLSTTRPCSYGPMEACLAAAADASDVALTPSQALKERIWGLTDNDDNQQWHAAVLPSVARKMVPAARLAANCPQHADTPALPLSGERQVRQQGSLSAAAVANASAALHAAAPVLEAAHCQTQGSGLPCGMLAPLGSMLNGSNTATDAGCRAAAPASVPRPAEVAPAGPQQSEAVADITGSEGLDLLSDMLAALSSNLDGSTHKPYPGLLAAAFDCSRSSSRLPAVQPMLPSNPFEQTSMPPLLSIPRGHARADAAAETSGAGSASPAMSAAGRQCSPGKECLTEPFGAAADDSASATTGPRCSAPMEACPAADVDALDGAGTPSEALKQRIWGPTDNEDNRLWHAAVLPSAAVNPAGNFDPAAGLAANCLQHADTPALAISGERQVRQQGSFPAAAVANAAPALHAAAPVLEAAHSQSQGSGLPCGMLAALNSMLDGSAAATVVKCRAAVPAAVPQAVPAAVPQPAGIAPAALEQPAALPHVTRLPYSNYEEAKVAAARAPGIRLNMQQRHGFRGCSVQLFDSNAGSRFRAIKLGHEVGRGTFGKAYAAVAADGSVLSDSIVKVYHGSNSKFDDKDTHNEIYHLQQLRNKAGVLQSSGYGCILPGSNGSPELLDLLQHRPIYCVILDRMDETLASLVERLGGLPLPEALSCLWSIMVTLDLLHSGLDRVYAHRDLKLQNILVKGLDIFLSDFGSMASYPHGSTDGFRTFCGTVEHMGPELLEQLDKAEAEDRGHIVYEAVGCYDEGIDLHACLIALLHMVCGDFQSIVRLLSRDMRCTLDRSKHLKQQLDFLMQGQNLPFGPINEDNFYCYRPALEALIPPMAGLGRARASAAEMLPTIRDLLACWQHRCSKVLGCLCSEAVLKHAHKDTVLSSSEELRFNHLSCYVSVNATCTGQSYG